MPKAQISPAGRIVAFFRSADLDAAKLVYGLCGDALRERTQKSEQAKAKAKSKTVGGPGPAVGAAVPAKAKVKSAAKKKSHKRKPVALPQAASPDDARTAAEEAGDLVGAGV